MRGAREREIRAAPSSAGQQRGRGARASEVSCEEGACARDCRRDTRIRARAPPGSSAHLRGPVRILSAAQGQHARVHETRISDSESIESIEHR